MRFAPFELGKHSALLNRRIAVSLALTAKRDWASADGEVWGFENFDHVEGLRLQWWGAGPEDWQPLIRAFHDLLRTVQEALKTEDYQPYQPELGVEPFKDFIAP